MPEALKISVVVIAYNEGASLRRTVENLRATLPGESEIVVVDDGSDDGSADFLAANGSPVRLTRCDRRGVAGARNQGARESSGEVIVFADAHIEAPVGWWVPMLDLLGSPSVGAVAPAIVDVERPQCKGFGQRLKGPDPGIDWLDHQGWAPYRVPLLPGCCWAMRRDTFETTGGFDEGMIRWGTEDTEFSLRLWLLGYELWLTPQVEVAHLFRDTLPYDVEWSWILHNKLRLAFVHFDDRRIERVVQALEGREGFATALALTTDSDFPSRRDELTSLRLHDDAWFFQRFGPEW